MCERNESSVAGYANEALPDDKEAPRQLGSSSDKAARHPNERLARFKLFTAGYDRRSTAGVIRFPN